MAKSKPPQCSLICNKWQLNAYLPYFQFTMSAIACPLPPQLHFHLPGIADEKGHKREGCTRKANPKGDGMFANRTPFAKHQPTDSAQITPARHRKAGEPSAPHLKKWSSSAELLHLSWGLSIQFPRHPVLRIFHFEARIG